MSRKKLGNAGCRIWSARKFYTFRESKNKVNMLPSDWCVCISSNLIRAYCSWEVPLLTENVATALGFLELIDEMFCFHSAIPSNWTALSSFHNRFHVFGLQADVLSDYGLRYCCLSLVCSLKGNA